MKNVLVPYIRPRKTIFVMCVKFFGPVPPINIVQFQSCEFFENYPKIHHIFPDVFFSKLRDFNDYPGRIMLLLTNCEVHTGKHSDRSLDVRTKRSEVRTKN